LVTPIAAAVDDCPCWSMWSFQPRGAASQPYGPHPIYIYLMDVPEGMSYDSDTSPSSLVPPSLPGALHAWLAATGCK
jgi:hypothetical protein